MKLLPSKKVLLVSKKNIVDIKKSIDNSCHKYSRAYDHRVKPLVGKRNGNMFHFYRAIDGYNSFLPIASGNIKQENEVVKINIILEINKGVQKIIKLFSYFLIFISGILFFIKGEGYTGTLAIVFAIYFISHLIFWTEVIKINKEIKKIFYE